MREFAEAWVALMEARAQGRHTQVRFMAASTMIVAGSQKLTDPQIREVILMLGRVWYLRFSLRHWAQDVGLINKTIHPI